MSSRRTNIVSCGLQVNKTVGDVGHGSAHESGTHDDQEKAYKDSPKYPMKTFHLLIFLCNLTRLERGGIKLTSLLDGHTGNVLCTNHGLCNCNSCAKKGRCRLLF